VARAKSAAAVGVRLVVGPGRACGLATMADGDTRSICQGERGDGSLTTRRASPRWSRAEPWRACGVVTQSCGVVTTDGSESQHYATWQVRGCTASNSSLQDERAPGRRGGARRGVQELRRRTLRETPPICVIADSDSSPIVSRILRTECAQTYSTCSDVTWTHQQH